MKNTYLERLEFWARWMLPAQEAESVVMDYRDIVGTPPRPEAELLRDLGRPREVIRQLAEPGAYRRWLIVFALLCGCILIPGITAHGPLWRIWDWCFYAPAVRIGGIYFGVRGPLLALAGLAAALVFFRLRGQRAGRIPKGAAVLLAVLAAWCIGVLGFDWLWMHDTQGFVRWVEQTAFTNALLPALWRAHSWVLQYGGAAAALIGVWSLVKARLCGRQWGAVYVLALAAMLLTMESLCLLLMLSEPSDSWYLLPLGVDCAVFAAGIAGAGVLLC